jgi:hypothetical protein
MQIVLLYRWFKVFRIRFVFDFKIVSYRNWRPPGCALALDFSEEQDFPERNLIIADHGEKKGFARSKLLQHSLCQSSPLRTLLKQPTSTEMALRNGASAEFRTMMEQITPLLLRKIQG